jgi:hypothetical protein
MVVTLTSTPAVFIVSMSYAVNNTAVDGGFSTHIAFDNTSSATGTIRVKGQVISQCGNNGAGTVGGMINVINSIATGFPTPSYSGTPPYPVNWVPATNESSTTTSTPNNYFTSVTFPTSLLLHSEPFATASTFTNTNTSPETFQSTTPPCDIDFLCPVPGGYYFSIQLLGCVKGYDALVNIAPEIVFSAVVYYIPNSYGPYYSPGTLVTVNNGTGGGIQDINLVSVAGSSLAHPALPVSSYTTLDTNITAVEGVYLSEPQIPVDIVKINGVVNGPIPSNIVAVEGVTLTSPVVPVSGGGGGGGDVNLASIGGTPVGYKNPLFVAGVY